MVASVTQAFCGDCRRIRLSTDGQLYTSLFATRGIELRDPLQRGDNDEAIARLIASTRSQRGDRYSQLRHAATVLPARRIEMPYIGG